MQYILHLGNESKRPARPLDMSSPGSFITRVPIFRDFGASRLRDFGALGFEALVRSV